MCSEFDYVATVAGGSRSNGCADSFGYGSYRLQSRTGHKQTIRLDFGHGVTSTAKEAALRNEAEYRTLIAGLKDLVDCIQRAGKNPSDCSLLVHTDSQLMVGQLTHLCLRHTYPTGRHGQVQVGLVGKCC